MSRFLCCLFLGVLMTASIGCQTESQYNKGYSRGVIACREAKKVGGSFLAAFNAGGNDMFYDLVASDQPAEYRTGYKDGYREEAFK
jgi:hypothetical protein